MRWGFKRKEPSPPPQHQFPPCEGCGATAVHDPACPLIPANAKKREFFIELLRLANFNEHARKALNWKVVNKEAEKVGLYRSPFNPYVWMNKKQWEAVKPYLKDNEEQWWLSPL